MTDRQRIEREALRRRNLAHRELMQELAKQGLTPTGRTRVRDPLARARAARSGWQRCLKPTASGVPCTQNPHMRKRCRVCEVRA